MKPNGTSPQNNDAPGWAANITLSQLTLMATTITIFGVLMLLTQITSETPTIPGLALVFVLAAIALRLWQVWFRLRKTRTTWHSNI
jgi:hypothetical protein